MGNTERETAIQNNSTRDTHNWLRLLDLEITQCPILHHEPVVALIPSTRIEMMLVLVLDPLHLQPCSEVQMFIVNRILRK